MTQEKVYRYIEARADDSLESLSKLIKQPSVSAKGEGIEKCSKLIQKMMQTAGLSTKILRAEKGNPVVYGERFFKKSCKTLLFYNHYDVQPPEPLEKWTYEPFSGRIAGTRIFGRGASDNKGNIVSRLKAVQALLEVTGNLPTNIKFLIEGEEEIGSPHLESVIMNHKELLSADAAIWEFGGTDRQGRPILYLGLKGVLSIEIRASGASKDVHSANAPIVPNPAWRLIWALSHLKNSDEKVLIGSFYEKALPPSSEEIRCLKNVPFEEDETRKELGLKEFLHNKYGFEALEALLYQPTCNINGLVSGYAGKGSKTVLPHEAVAKIDFRLVPNQKPNDIYQKLVKHLKTRGFGDLKTIKQGSTEPTKTPINDPFVKLVAKTAEKVYGKEAVIYPISAASGPMHLFRNLLGYPVVSVGCSHLEANTHAPNENLRIKSFVKGTKYIAALINDFSS